MSLYSKVSVTGLGYIGLPIAVALSRHYSVIAYDHSSQRIQELQAGHDRTCEIKSDTLKASQVQFTNDSSLLHGANFHIIAVPTPIDNANTPDLALLKEATTTVAKNLKRGDTVVYESTVYPGLTREICIPILERESGLTESCDFGVGYSPERVNPNDGEHGLSNVVKLISATNPDTLSIVKQVYEHIVTAGVYETSSLEVAEAAKVIENTQRDINIALVNELAIIFNRLGINTEEVLKAAGTKWNFLPFKPGLVGGHCIGVDPFYLTHRAEQTGYHPQVILAGRRINDNMGKYIAEQTVKLLLSNGFNSRESHVNILGLTFKENCVDLRNSGVANIIAELQKYNINLHVHDSCALADEANKLYNIELIDWENLKPADAMIIAVAHQDYKDMDINTLLSKVKPNGYVIDVKSILSSQAVAESGKKLWQL